MATTVLALLNEPDYSLKEYALHALDSQVNELWPEIADHIPVIEELYEDNRFHAQKLAALVVAKVYYNLGDLEQALKYALAAGNDLDLTEKSQFVDTMISQSIQSYIAQRQAQENAAAGGNAEANFDSNSPASVRLTQIVEEMLERCVGSGQVALALGISLDARRLDLVEAQLQSAHDVETLAFVVDAAALISSRAFRRKVLEALSKVVDAVLHSDKSANAQYYSLATRLAVLLDDSVLAIRLLEEAGREEGLACQAAFDFAAAASPELRDKVSEHFRASSEASRARLVRILSGVPTCDYEVTFLSQQSHADAGLLQASKQSLDARNSIFHSALSFQNALLNLGTTNDQFFRANSDWLTKATQWAQFTATASIGVIHRGDLACGRSALEPYAAKDDPSSAHIRGGAMYALGLVYANFGKDVLPELQKCINDATSDIGEEGSGGSGGSSDHTSPAEVLLHGSCLGAGLAGMQTQDEKLCEQLRLALFQDSNVGGLGAGLAIGLVQLGAKPKQLEDEMLQYARSTGHEKIVFGLSLGIAFVNLFKEEACESVVAELSAEHDPQLRYGACFTLGLAYAGTSNGAVAKRLLHTAVSDTSDDVRRAAMMVLGFVYLRTPAVLPRMVELLSASHNPHVRYGSAIALGVGCAGTGLIAAVDVLEPMLKDPVDFVRQGAMIALALVLVQHTEQSHPRAKSVREHLAKVVRTKNEDALAKYGAALALGILDAGGCNTTIQLEHKATGTLNVRAVVGLAMFLQYWSWFPLAHFVSLCFTPTALLCVQPNLKMPKFEVQCEGAPHKRFAYPQRFTEPSEKAPEQLVTAILSTTLKELRRRKHAEERSGKHEAEEKKRRQEDADAEEKEKERQEEANKTEFAVENLSRVVPWQRRFIRFPSNGVFKPVTPNHDLGGVVVVAANGTVPADTQYVLMQRHAQGDFEEAPLPLPFVIPVEAEQ